MLPLSQVSSNFYTWQPNLNYYIKILNVPLYNKTGIKETLREKLKAIFNTYNIHF
jgi:hypothetical protein